jgi:hypothetical protein
LHLHREFDLKMKPVKPVQSVRKHVLLKYDRAL